MSPYLAGLINGGVGGGMGVYRHQFTLAVL